MASLWTPLSFPGSTGFISSEIHGAGKNQQINLSREFLGQYLYPRMWLGNPWQF